MGQLVKLLLESFNPHVRYASCIAVGISMAGTGDAESVALLEPMLDDMTDYVRQGALMGTSMIYMQQSDSARKIRSFRERLSNIIRDKHQSTLTKMGAILSKGIIDAGGRNCTLVMGGRFGFTKMSSAIGMVLWLQHWHWFPMMHMFSLALTPTFTIGLNQDLKFPKSFEIQCNAKPSAFAYPKKLEEKKEEAKKRVETVTLSTTAKNKARLARRKVKIQQWKKTQKRKKKRARMMAKLWTLTKKRRRSQRRRKNLNHHPLYCQTLVVSQRHRLMYVRLIVVRDTTQFETSKSHVVSYW